MKEEDKHRVVGWSSCAPHSPRHAPWPEVDPSEPRASPVLGDEATVACLAECGVLPGYVNASEASAWPEFTVSSFSSGATVQVVNCVAEVQRIHVSVDPMK